MRPGNRTPFPIATQLIIAIVGVVMASLVITGGILILVSYRSETDRLHVIQQSVAQVASGRISSYIDDLQRKISYLARVRGITSFDATARESLLKALTDQNKAYETVGFVDRDGHLTQSLSPYGVVPPREWASTTAFRRACLVGEDFLGQVEPEGKGIPPSLLLAVPVRDRRNEVDGILFARIGLGYLWALLEEIHVGKSGYVYILDQRDFLIAQSGPPPQSFELRDISRDLPDGFLDSSQASASHSYLGLRGTEVVGLSARVPTTNWHIVVEIPVSEANAPAVLLAELLAAILVVVLLCSVALGLALGRRLTRPLQELTAAAARMRLGDLGTRVDIEQENELKVLAEAFNHMAGQLAANFALLEAKHHLLFETISQGIIYYDTAGKILAANPAAQQILNLKPDRFLGKSHSDPEWKVVREDGSPLPDEEHPLSKAIRTGQRVEQLTIGVSSPGNVDQLWLSVATVPLREPGQAAPIQYYSTFEDITQRKRAEEELNDALREKQELLGELQHRIKNSFSLIESMTHLASMGAGAKETRDILEELDTRIMAVAELYALLYEGGSFDEVRLDNYCDRVAAAMVGLAKGVSVVKDMECVTVPAKMAASIGLILTELVTNCLKYAFPAGKRGTITISLKRHQSHATLEVRDDGRGLPAGFDLGESSGMGLKLVQGLSKQVGGRFSLESGAGGTRCTLELGLGAKL
jgi:PAS domain S-box-containing protein